LIGGSVLDKRGEQLPSWDVGTSAPKEIRKAEHNCECQVSVIIRAMPLLWLAVDDDPGPTSARGFIERNSIALLSNCNEQEDLPSKDWLGHYCRDPNVRASGLWNSDHVREAYSPAFLTELDRLIAEMKVKN
jgi:hypothetical protein